MEAIHLQNLKEIEDFLIEIKTPYRREDNIFYLKDNTLEIRYVDSENHKMDYAQTSIILTGKHE